MAWGLDSIKEGLASLEKSITETARSATNTGGMKGTSLKKEKMESWSKSKEGNAIIDVALSVGLKGIDSVGKSADTAEAFINDVYEKKDELMELGRKLVDKKSYEETGEKALDLQYSIESFVQDNSKSFGDSIRKAAIKLETDGAYALLSGAKQTTMGGRGDKAIFDAAKKVGTSVGDALGLTDTPFEKLAKGVKGLSRNEKTDSAAARGRQANSKVKEKSFMDVLTDAKESSMRFTSKAVEAVYEKAAEFKGEVAKTYGVSVEKVEELAASAKELPEKVGTFPERLMKAMEDKYAERHAEVQAEMFRMIDEGAAKSAARDAAKAAKPKTPNRDSLKSKAGMKVLLDGGRTAELTAAAAKMTDEELAKVGIVRIPGYTTKSGTKVKEHYRKIGK